MRHSVISDAYVALGLAQDASLEEVKATYRQLALKTHPDKNPENKQSTIHFQRLSEAYNVLLKHLDRPSQPHHPSYDKFDNLYDDYYEEEEDYCDSDDCYDEYEECYSDDEDLEFHMFLFNEMMQGRASRYSNMRYFQENKLPHETKEEHNVRLRKLREEQEAAERRRARDEQNRKLEQQHERKRDRTAALSSQDAKKSKKKAEVEDSRKFAAAAARSLQEKSQRARSEVFAAARASNTQKVKRGVSENNINTVGGEVLKGFEDLARIGLIDTKETLLHIAAQDGNLELVKWLDTHNADIKERSSSDLTAFHLAVQAGHNTVVEYFCETYSPDNKDFTHLYSTPASTSSLLLSLDSGEPELTWLILDKGLASKHEIDQALFWINSTNGQETLSRRGKLANHKELSNLLMSFGGFTPISPQTGNFSSFQLDETVCSPSNSDLDGSSGSEASLPPSQQSMFTATPLPTEDKQSSYRSYSRETTRGHYPHHEFKPRVSSQGECGAASSNRQTAHGSEGRGNSASSHTHAFRSHGRG